MQKMLLKHSMWHQPVEVSSNAVKLTRRATSPDEIKWPQECSLLEFTKTPTSLLDALELCYQQYVKRGGPKAVNISEQMIAEIATQRDEKLGPVKHL